MSYYISMWLRDDEEPQLLCPANHRSNLFNSIDWLKMILGMRIRRVTFN